MKPSLIIIALVLGGCASASVAPPVTYEVQQRKEGIAKELGYFVYSDSPEKHYVEYQGTDGNTLEELEKFVRRRAAELCQSSPAAIEVEHGVWVGRRISWVPGSSVNPLLGPLVPVPTGHGGTYPKVSAKVTCAASNPL